MANGGNSGDSGSDRRQQIREGVRKAKAGAPTAAKYGGIALLGIGVVLLGLLLIVSFGVSVYSMFANLMNDAVFLATVVVFAYGMVFWNFSRHFFGELEGPAALAAHYIISIFIFALFGIVLQLFSRAASLGSANPPALLYLVSMAFFVIMVYRVAEELTEGHEHSRWLMIGSLFVALVLVFFIGQWAVGGWGNIGGVIGEAGYNLEDTLVGVPLDILGNVWSSFQAQLSVCNNPTIGQIQCTADLYMEGAVYEAVAGSASVSQCVQQKIENQCGPATESEEVTDPLIVEVQEPIIEPLQDHVRFFVPVTNTLVNDIQGRVIDIPAREVSVDIAFQYLDKVVASEQTSVGEIQNGDTANIMFNERDDGSYYFPRFELSSAISRTEIQRRLIDVSEDCENGVDYPDEASSECQASVNWFLDAFDGNAEDVSDLQEGSFLSTARVGFIAKTRLDLPGSFEEEFPQPLYEEIDEYLGDSNILAPDREHDVTITVDYKYSADAAFTQSSRWKSGNQLLKVWRYDDWNELTPEERQEWRQQNCDEVTRAGETFQKQRTASLTTPIVPVMYADCGGVLFSRFSADAGYTGDIPIQVAATVNDNVRERVSDKGFKIISANTNCGDGSLDGLTGKWYNRREEGGFQVDPVTITRSDVTVDGERMTIGCRVSMDVQVRLQDTTTFQEGGDEESDG